MSKVTQLVRSAEPGFKPRPGSRTHNLTYKLPVFNIITNPYNVPDKQINLFNRLKPRLSEVK